jgi:transposase
MFKTNDIVTDGITEGIEARQQRGLAIAARCKVVRGREGEWTVPSQTDGHRYVVKLGAAPHCTCPDHETRGCMCKHIYAVQYVIEREQNADGSVTVTETLTATKRTTYPQNWPAYNKAQTNEGDDFLRLLGDLCEAIETPAPKSAKGGRPTLPLRDAVFSAVFKVYSTFSARRFTSDLRAAFAAGQISKLPHFNSVLNYLEKPEMTDILLSLIERSSLPLKSVEVDFAVDSTGFMSSRMVRWYDQKYGTSQEEHTWVKTHICTGVKTNIITAVEIHDRNANDNPLLPALVDATAKNFTLREVSADKGYLAVSNMDAIQKHGAAPFIAFKSNSKLGQSTLWDKMFHFFSFKKDEFLAHYHKRSNVESTVMMVKSKFGDSVRSKGDLAMKNEVLAKIVCHNICCLISAIYELGIEPVFA